MVIVLSIIAVSKIVFSLELLLTLLFSNAGDSRGPIKNITVSGQALTAILDNLHPSFLYNIRIRANNSIGLGAPSHQVAAKLLEEGKYE